MKLLFIDLETTGLPLTTGFKKYYPYEQLSKYDSSRIVQFAMLVYEYIDNEWVMVREHNYIIKPNGFRIMNSHIHGIDHEVAEACGIEFKEMVKNIIDDIQDAILLVAHNVKFDYNVFMSELHRNGCFDIIELFKTIPHFCTSSSTIDIVKIKHNNRYKFPKLTELYKFLFAVEPQGMHNALQDIRCTAKCFFELLRRNLFVIEH